VTGTVHGRRILLLDNDIALHVAGAAMLDRVTKLLGVGIADVRRLESLPYMLRRSRRLPTVYSAETLRRTAAFCHRVRPLDDTPAESVMMLLGRVPDVQRGEATLYGVLAERPSYLLASGDKRAMVALSTTASLESVRQAVAGRVICLETILRGLVTHHGAGEIGPAFVGTSRHQTLSVIFSETNVRNQQRCLATIDAYLAYLRRQVGNDFLFEP
jgi:hypothetical protein